MKKTFIFGFGKIGVVVFAIFLTIAMYFFVQACAWHYHHRGDGISAAGGK